MPCGAGVVASLAAGSGFGGAGVVLPRLAARQVRMAARATSFSRSIT